MKKIVLRLALGLVLLALVSSTVLLASDSNIGAVLRRWAAAISAVPLLAVGLSFLAVQVMIRPRWAELLKNVLLAATFLLWGIVQLMKQNLVSKRLGDLVIVLYVAELAWTILVRVKPMGKTVDEND
jgi:hypothetical protein